MHYILWTPTEFAPMKIFPLSVLKPDDAAINFVKSDQNQNLKLLGVKKTLFVTPKFCVQNFSWMCNFG